MKNVIVVDDNPIVRRHLRGLLERDGCLVSEAGDGVRALALVDERPFDVMFLDLHMPTLDGTGVLLGLTERKKALPVVLITSSDSSGEIVRAYKLGAKDYLLKPFREPQLRRALKQATGFDATTVLRTPFDLALVDQDEDFAQLLRGLLADGDAIDHVDQLQQVPEVLGRRHQLVLVGSLDGGAAANAVEAAAESLGDIAAQADPNAALVRLLPTGVKQLPELTVFHAGVPRGDEAALKRLLRALRSGGALSSGPLVRTLRYDGQPDFEHLYWWALRQSLEGALERALSTGSRVTVDFSLSPTTEERLNAMVDWVLEFGSQRMVEISVVRPPTATAIPAPVASAPAAPPAPAPALPGPVTSGPPSVAPGTAVVTPTAREGATRVQPPLEQAIAVQRLSEPVQPASQSAPAIAGPPPIAIPGFELGAQFGEGGMSRVYHATQKSLRRQVCVKVLREEFANDPSLAERFQDEGIALATLRHPNIVSVLDVGRSDDGQLYMVMEYVEGGDLRGLLGRVERVAVRESVDLTLQLLGGLAEAHGHGIIHRDLKPSNVLLATLKDGSRLVKLVDFGIAKLMEGLRRRPAQTRTGTVVGTPGYMAPEQLLGMEVSFSTDLYAVGVILFEMVTGRRPFVARDEFELAQLTMMTPVPHPREFGADLPDELDRLLNALLAKNPKDRPQSAAEVRATLSAITLPAAA